MTYEATGAGDPTFNGIYTESGTYNGQPAYTNGLGWLWYYPTFGVWMISTNKGDVPPMYSGEATLPGNWSVAAGPPPAPTLDGSEFDFFMVL